MKKLAFLLVFALCLTLCGCPALENTPQAPGQLVTKEVYITAGTIKPGMTAKDVLVEVTIDHQPVACRVQLTGFTSDGYWEMSEDEPVTDPFLVRLDVFYSLPKGYDLDQVNVTMKCDGGTYDGTGSIGYDDAGNVEAWSHAFYGELPEEEPQSTEQTQPTEQQQTSSDVPIQTAPHVHTWVEKNENTYISCTTDMVKTYACTCGEGKQETIPAPGHDMKDGAVTQPTCTDSGRQTKRCSRCSYVIVIETPATGHSWSDWQYESGRVHKHTCSTCGAGETANHTIPSGSVTCSGCGADIIN